MAMHEKQLLFLVWDILNDHARRGLMKAINRNLRQLFVSNRVEKYEHDITPDAPSPNPLRTHKVLLSMSPREGKSCLLMKQMKKIFFKYYKHSLLGFKFVDDVCESSSASPLGKYSSQTTSASVK